MSRVTKAIILAAGRSTRYGKNKLVDPILGKSTIEYCIEFCIENGIEDCYVTISKADFFFKNNTKLSHPIIEKLNQYKTKLNIFYEFQQDDEYGPGAAIKVWSGKFNEAFLCLFGDNYYQGNIGLEYHDPESTVVTYKDYGTRARNLQLASILENVVIEKPHGIVSGRYFCGYMIFSKEAFDNLDSIKMSNRNEYEITHLINSMDNLKFEELNICWYDLTYENDKAVIEDLIKTC
jgi:dTDP-glucose pyrophosphorylase|tara:strand:- start:667 stop:1371 length:705 start_codon:yes stop_codon:yes gene_type:complete